MENNQYLDEEGYPTEAALVKIRNCHWKNRLALLDFIAELWRWDGPYNDQVRYGNIIRYKLSTGGWSGNENLIRAFMENTRVWNLTWVSSRRGGHFEFEYKPIKGE